jgi:hypothetical protein
MANAQAVLVYELEMPIPFTVSDAAAIEKGDFVQLSDPMTVSLVDGDDKIAGGIAAEEKIANDGKTKIAVYRRGILVNLYQLQLNLLTQEQLLMLRNISQQVL